MGNTIFIRDKRVWVRPLINQIEAIQKLEPPTTIKDGRSFAGMVNFLIRLLSLFKYILDESGTAENKVEVLFSHDKLLLASILRLLHQVTEEMLV